jgi:hypothetical protein
LSVGGGLAAAAALLLAAAPAPRLAAPLFPNAPAGDAWRTVTELAWDFDSIPFRRDPIYQPDGGAHVVEYGYDTVRAASIVRDSALPGGTRRVLHYRLPAGMAGGGSPSMIGQYPGFGGDGPLRWDPARNTGHLYIGFWVRFSPNYDLNRNVGQKVFYLKSDHPANRSIAHMPGILMSDGAGGNQLWPEYQPQSPFGNYSAPHTRENDLNDGRWHLIETLQGPNTPGRKDGRLSLWIDDRAAGQWTDAMFFDEGQLPSLNRLEIAPIYGGGLNPVPSDQWIRVGPVLVRSR